MNSLFMASIVLEALHMFFNSPVKYKEMGILIPWLERRTLRCTEIARMVENPPCTPSVASALDEIPRRHLTNVCWTSKWMKEWTNSTTPHKNSRGEYYHHTHFVGKATDYQLRIAIPLPTKRNDNQKWDLIPALSGSKAMALATLPGCLWRKYYEQGHYKPYPLSKHDCMFF